MVRLFAVAWALLMLGLSTAKAQDGYAEMLRYLTTSSIGGNALAGASGAIAVNLAAGDSNLQSNAAALAIGPLANVQIEQRQRISALSASVPDAMVADISGNALSGARGLISINQASGVGNREANAIAVAVSLAQQGIEEQTSSTWLAGLGGQTNGAAGGRSQANPSSSPRSASVAGTALRGAEGVVQFNQIAGMGNTAGNRLLITVDLPPR